MTKFNSRIYLFITWSFSCLKVYSSPLTSILFYSSLLQGHAWRVTAKDSVIFAVFAVTRQACSLYLFNFLPGKTTKKPCNILQQTMQVQGNACVAVNCKPSNNCSSNGPHFHHTVQQLHCSARVSCSQTGLRRRFGK